MGDAAEAIRLLRRNLDSIRSQTFTDYEIVVSDDSAGDEIYKWLVAYTEHRNFSVKYVRNPGEKSMACNTNYAIDQSEGEIIKILFQDDYFYSPKSLADIIEHFTPTFNWIATSCVHTFDGVEVFNLHNPFYSHSENTIGSPSVVAFRREVRERFDPQFHWVLDLDLYRRLLRYYGRPKLLDHVTVVIGLHQNQMTNKLSDYVKQLEFIRLEEKHE